MSDPGTVERRPPRSATTPRLANEIEAKWQDRWDAEHTFWAPNPAGPLDEGFDAVADRQKLYVLDMFPYPSGAGLHVGHPLGYIGTDVYARFMRMSGHNVLHAMGYDAFGLPAEQYAVQTGQHPRVTTEANVANMRRQLRALGLGHDPRRSVATTDSEYYRWTQWIFLQLFDSWYDDDAGRARPIAELVVELEAARGLPDERRESRRARRGRSSTPATRRAVVDSYRLAYLDEAPVNWCPALGTVLANEEVTADGRSERGQPPGVPPPAEASGCCASPRTPTACSPTSTCSTGPSRSSDAAQLDRPQRRRRGRRSRSRSTTTSTSTVFTTRPDTLFGATYMVLAPEHPLVDEIMPTSGRATLRPGPRRHPRRVAGHLRRRRAARGRGARTASSRRRRPSSSARPREGEDRRVHRRVRDQPDQRRARSRSSSPTTC